LAEGDEWLASSSAEPPHSTHDILTPDEVNASTFASMKVAARCETPIHLDEAASSAGDRGFSSVLRGNEALAIAS
jgi:hypothetical protein